jgi:hypothetical protein
MARRRGAGRHRLGRGRLAALEDKVSLPTINLHLDGAGAWKDLLDRMEAGQVLHSSTIRIACLPGGMESGKISVAFRFDLEDGRVAIAEISLALLYTAVDAIKARYGDPR